MLKIDITGENQVIFRNEKDGRVFYNTSLSKKDVNGNWENGNIQIQFKKGVEVENKAKINIKNAWLTFYKSQDGKTVPYIFCNEFSAESEQSDSKIKFEEGHKDEKWDACDEISDDDLPF